MVATRPLARRVAGSDPAMSTWAMIQPPNTSPYTLASDGAGITRSVGILPAGSALVGALLFSGVVILKFSERLQSSEIEP
jgi:hypothetical protein